MLTQLLRSDAVTDAIGMHGRGTTDDRKRASSVCILASMTQMCTAHDQVCECPSASAQIRLGGPDWCEV